ncbi:MAG: hypothetical protein D3916_00055 [Candidatus Electrothrix sp. MAN1_4]|nr:hypothetical protein [Candidatus Electrothrix sp. MAN1_4]
MPYGDLRIAAEDEGGDDMNERPPCHGKVDQRSIEFGVDRLINIVLVQIIEDRHSVEDEVNVEDDDVIGEHRTGKVEDAYPRNRVPGTVWPTHMVQDEVDADNHEDHGDGLTNDGQLLHIFTLINISRSHHQHCCRCYGWAVNKIGDEQLPNDLVCGSGDDKAGCHLYIGGDKAYKDKKGKEEQPAVIDFSSFHGIHAEVAGERYGLQGR